MAYDMTSGGVASALLVGGVRLSAATVQRYAREGRIPARRTPGGRFRYDVEEVRAALEVRSAAQTLLSTVPAGLGLAELPGDSSAEQLRRGARGYLRSTSAPAFPSSSGLAPAATHSQLEGASVRTLAFG